MMSGSLSRAGRPEHPAEADAIDATLITLYQGASDVHEKTELLRALGNSAGPSEIPVVEEALRDSRVPVRSSAARALRLAPGPDVDGVLADVITSDPDAQVRADAIFATRFRHPLPSPLTDALLHAAGADETRDIRSDAVAVLIQNPTASVRIPETLARIAELDADSGIRRQARGALAALSPE
jgi:HEAT repeat protein